MTRDFRHAPPEPNRSRAGPACAVLDYDDGNPATVFAPARRPVAAPQRSFAEMTPATSFGATPRAAAIDYDDGNPATIAGGRCPDSAGADRDGAGLGRSRRLSRR